MDRREKGGGGELHLFPCIGIGGEFFINLILRVSSWMDNCVECSLRYGTARYGTLIVRNGEGLAAALVIRFGCEFLERGWILSMVCACFSAPYPFLACSMSGCKLLNEKRGSMCT